MASREAQTLSPSCQKHKDMYKGRALSWKDTYRQRCLERLKTSRDKYIGRLRRISKETEEDDEPLPIRSLMAQEWKKLQKEEKHLPSLTTNSADLLFDDTESDNIDEVLSLFDEIQAELMREEEKILEEYENGVQFDEQVLQATIDALQADDLVLCPVCSRHPLMLNKGIVFCKCGVRIDTEQDCLTLPAIKQSLTEGTDHHSELCSELPLFNVVNHIGVDNLIMTCQTCDYMYIIV